ncbi:Ig-like domain-containing protein, partial [Patescibacteria group bacterium]|nr:Ig-like domain-containing protein [Patescibacteria group bacterium]
LTKITSGEFSGRIVAGGLNTDLGTAASWFSTDEGDTWSAATSVAANTTKVTALQSYRDAVLAGMSGAASGDEFIYIDPIGDGSWAVNSKPPEITGTISAISDFVLTNGGNQVVASYTANAIDSGQAPLQYSADGSNWFVATMASGTSPVTGAIALAATSDGTTVYATTNGNYILKSTDSGATWTAIAASGTANAKVIYVTASGGVVVINGADIIWSFDEGTDFVAQTTDVPDSISASEGFILMGNSQYLLGVTDSGGDGDVYGDGRTADVCAELNSGPTVTNDTGVAFTSLTGFVETYASTSERTDAEYQIKVDGSSTWYYYDGSDWAAASNLTEANTATDVNTNIGTLMSDLGITSGTFYFKAIFSSFGDVRTTSIALDMVTLSYVNDTTSPGGGIPPDKRAADREPPHSRIEGILGDNGQLITPFPANIYKPGFTIVASATDNLAVRSVSLYWSKSKTGGYELVGEGASEIPMPGYWAWYFNTDGADGDGTYYFYSVATDWADPTNTEILPKYQGWEYDAATTITTDFPYIKTTYPKEGAKKVGVLENLSVTFSRDMDRSSVEAAFSLLAGQTNTGGRDGLELGWSFDWSQMTPGGPGLLQNRSVIIRHSIPFNYLTAYTAYINPFIAKDINGAPLSQDNPSKTQAYNPWHFITDMPQKPDLSNSSKNVSIYDEDYPDQIKDDAEPGDFLYYTIQIRNDDSTLADHVDLVDVIPPHTVFMPGSIRVYIPGMLWIAMQPPPEPDSQFEAWYEESPDGIDGNGRVVGTGYIAEGSPIAVSFMVKIDKPLVNGTIITNIAEISDNVNPTHYKPVDTVVIATSNWADKSYKEAANSNPNRDPGSAKVGDTLTYTVYLENSGNMDAVGVVVTDRVPNYTGITGTPTGGLVYNPSTNTLVSQVGIDGWSGVIPAGDSHTFTFKVTVDEQPPASIGKVTNISTIQDNSGEYSLIKEITIVADPPSTPPYILSPTIPAGGATSVKLFSPIVITFSDSIKPETLSYTVSDEVKVIYDNLKDSGWKTTWSANLNGDPNAKVTIQPNKPWQTGHYYTIRVLDAVGTNDLHLSKSGDVPNNTWGFTVARPALYFTDKSILSFKFGTVSQKITVKLGDWINVDDAASGGEKQYAAYSVENPDGLSVKLHTSSQTGAFDIDPKGKFDGSVISVSMPQGTDTISFYYTDSAPTNFETDGTLPFILPSVSYLQAGYLIYSEQRFFVVTADDVGATSDQIYFQTGHQTIPAGELSNPIQFEIRSPKGEQIDIKQGRQFLLETTSPTGEFYNQFKLPINQYVTLQGEQSTKIYYVLPVIQNTKKVTFYYMDTVPGTYYMSVHDKEMKIAAEASGPAASRTQTVIVVPIDDQELEEEILEELEEVEDETGRKLAQIDIDPTETTVLPGGVRTFKAVGYDTDGAKIDELKFSWYVIGGGGTVLKKGLSADNHSTTFTAGTIPGIYADTVLVATLYNGEIQAAMASVTIADVINYGGPGELPSTGVNGIQMLFIVLTLLAAVALAAVEHYEKTHFYEEAKSS